MTWCHYLQRTLNSAMRNHTVLGQRDKRCSLWMSIIPNTPNFRVAVMFQNRASRYFASLIVPYRLVFHRWGHQCLLCKGWLSGQPPVPAPGRHRILSRWALLVTIAGCCWWRLTCPPSPSKTRWSSSARPREITSAGGGMRIYVFLNVDHLKSNIIILYIL